MADPRSAPLRFRIRRAMGRMLGALGADFWRLVLWALGASTALGLVQLIVVVITAASISSMEGISDGPWPGLLFLVEIGGLSLVQASVTRAMLIQGAATAMERSKGSSRAMLRAGVVHALPLAAIAALAGGAVGFGLLWLVAPGAFLAVIWAAAAPAQVIEKRGVIAALTRSAALTHGHRWAVLGFSLAVWLIEAALLGLALFGLGLLVNYNPAANDAAGGWTAFLLSLLFLFCLFALNALLALVGALARTAIFVELRSVKELGGGEATAAVFE